MMKNESGRSMVEMLGVLAIIGVLSVGGIAGYTMAMRKYKANEILSAASQCHILARSANEGNGVDLTSDVNCSTLGVSLTDVTLKVDKTGTSSDRKTYAIQVTAQDEDVCKAVRNIYGTASSKSTACSSNVTTLYFS